MAIRFALAPGLIALLLLTASRAIAETPAETTVLVEAGPEAARAGAGRLLLFAQEVDPTVKEPATSANVNQFFYGDVEDRPSELAADRSGPASCLSGAAMSTSGLGHDRAIHPREARETWRPASENPSARFH
jgi:hypothetical protein